MNQGFFQEFLLGFLPRFFSKFIQEFPSGDHTGISSGVPYGISSGFLPGVFNSEISWALTDYCLLFLEFRSVLLQSCFLEFLSDFLLGSFSRDSFRNSSRDSILNNSSFSFLKHSESFGSFQCSFKFFYRPKDSPGFDLGVLLGIPFEISPEIFIKISPGIPSEVPPGILDSREKF